MQLPVLYFWLGWQSEHAEYPLCFDGKVVRVEWLDMVPGDQEGYVWQLSHFVPNELL